MDSKNIAICAYFKSINLNFKFRSTPIKGNQRIIIKDDGTLEIAAVRASDVGQYVCMVRLKSVICYHLSKNYLFRYLHSLEMKLDLPN